MAAETAEYRRVIVAASTDLGFQREMIKGISSYANCEGRWHLEIHAPDRSCLRGFAGVQVQGLLIAPSFPIKDVSEAVQVAPAVVGLAMDCTRGDLDNFEVDNIAIGALAADFFLDRGYKNFAYFGPPGGFSMDRLRGLQAGVERRGYSVDSYTNEWSIKRGRYIPTSRNKGDLKEWIAKLPKPAALLAFSDWWGRVICRECVGCNIRVPEDVVVLGVDNDDFSTAISNPALSSIILPWHRMGREAAELLDQRISGAPKREVAKYTPTGVFERNSTGSIAIVDREVRSAIQFIRDHLGRAFTVDDVVLAAKSTRRSLERKFRAALGRTPLDEIHRQRIERARYLLSNTDMIGKEIAQRCGFTRVGTYVAVFRELSGQTPAEYRQAFHNSLISHTQR